MFAMHFDERRGDVEGARTRYQLVLGELAPRLLSATVAAANFEKRQVSEVRGGEEEEARSEGPRGQSCCPPLLRPL